MATARHNVTCWTDRKIPFEFEPNYPYESDVRNAMERWEAAGGVWFSKHGNEPNYIVIKNTSGSSGSPVGMVGGPQSVFINAGYKALHELGHALGLIHEHQRSDRDNFVDMQWGNIERGTANSNFIIETNSNNLTGYDRVSVMHYPAPATGWGGWPSGQEVWTMRWKADRNVKLGAGPNQGWGTLSAEDKKGLPILYNAVPGWGNQVIGPFGGTTDAPRFAAFGNKVWSVWKGSGDDHIWYATYNGHVWSGQSTIPNVGTSRSPAIAEHNGILYAAWRGVGKDAGIWYATNSGSGWSGQTKVPGVGTSEGPAMCSFAGKLWLAWKGSGDDGIWFTTFDKSWRSQSRVSGVGTSNGPALASSNGVIYMAWRGVGNDAGIWYASNSGSGWSGQTKSPNAGTSKSPALADYNGSLWMCWRGVNDDGIWWATYTAANGWSGQARIAGVGTADSPTLATLGGKLRLGWSGVGHSRLWYASYPETR